MKQAISTLVVIALVALVCYSTYYLCDLKEVFKVEISYLHWYGITVLANVLFPVKDIFSLENKKDDNKGPKIPRDVSSNGF